VRVLRLRAGGRRLRGWSLSAAAQRVRGVYAPVLQTSLGAGVAWYVAHDLLGHAEPFFAPIAAAVSLSTSHVQRSRRSVQMMVGVLLGIGVSEVLHPLIGDGAVSIGVVVLVTLLLAVAIGIGFVGEGMMFFNQAAASAVLVIALHRAGTGGERAVDALVGGGVALVIGVGFFPADPLKLLWNAENGVLRALVRILARRSPSASDGHVNPGIEPDMDPDMDWALAASHELHRELSALTQARGTARTSVRVAPRRFVMRSAIEQEDTRVSHLYLLAGGTLSLMRAMWEADASGAGYSPACAREVDELARAVRALLDASRPWSQPTVADASERMRELLSRPLTDQSAGSAIVTGAARRVARDLIGVLPDRTDACG
jgi:uncharacterized membrane protein YgaE (UPF0421/DUF939 family)